MPGRHVTDCQKRLFMQLRKTHTTEVASAKAGFSRATGYRLDADPLADQEAAKPRGRTRWPMSSVQCGRRVPARRRRLSGLLRRNKGTEFQ